MKGGRFGCLWKDLDASPFHLNSMMEPPLKLIYILWRAKKKKKSNSRRFCSLAHA